MYSKGSYRNGKEESCEAEESPALRVGQVCFVLIICAAYFASSTGVIMFNKYLMHIDRFPFAVPLVLLHTAFASVFSLILFLVKPSLFPSLRDPEPQNRVVVDSDLILRGAFPIAALFAVQLVLSNTAYLHSTVAFLQMMKESNLVLVYIFSLVAALEKFSYRSCTILVLMLFATALTIHGEIDFSPTGFAMQACSQFFESGKIVLQTFLLSNAGKKLDVFTYMLLVMPVCFVILGTFSCGLMWFPHNSYLRTPHWSDIQLWWKYLLASACLAFCLNATVALVMKHCSAVSFILAGIAKDALIVILGGVFLHEIISIPQYIGFTFQLSLIFIWSLVKIFPEKFEDGIFSGLANLLCSYGHEQDDALPIHIKSTSYGAASLLLCDEQMKKGEEGSTYITDEASSCVSCEDSSDFLTPPGTTGSIAPPAA